MIGTAGGKEKCEIARQNGAQWVIDSKSEDVVARVKEITGGKGVDVIFDGVGKATFESDLEMVARKGTVAVFGNAVRYPHFFWRIRAAVLKHGRDMLTANSPVRFRPSMS